MLMRSKYINKYAMELVRKHHSSLTLDYAKNKELIGQMAPNMTKRQVNEVAGYVVRILKRMQSEA